MKQKIFFAIAMLSLLCMAVFVSAYMEQIQGDEDRITYTASVREGWNLLNAGTIVFNKLALTENSDIQPEDIGAVFYYSPSQKEYIQIYPNLDEEKFNIEDGRNAQTYLIESSSAWVYVERDGMIEYETDDVVSMTKRQLTSGWNFVSVTENALGKSLNDLKGTCNIQRAYYYLQGYKELDLNMDFPNDMSSQGLLIKVSNDCSFSSSGSNGGITPPQIPGNNDVIENTGLRKMIEDYYYDEFSYEECDLNNAQGYTSTSDCYDAWKCLAKEYANLIPEEDLEDLVGEMSEHGGESGSIYYHEENPSVDEEMRNSKFALCLSGVYEGY